MEVHAALDALLISQLQAHPQCSAHSPVAAAAIKCALFAVQCTLRCTSSARTAVEGAINWQTKWPNKWHRTVAQSGPTLESSH